MRVALRSLRLAWRSFSLAARLLVVAGVLAAWLVSSVLTAALPGMFLLASTLAGLVVDATQTVEGKHKAKVKEVDGRLKSKTVEADDLRKSNARLKGELDEAKWVRYRGGKRAVKEAISDTTKRIAKRTSIATGRNFATIPGESIPVFGIFVIVGATAWELSDSCELMHELRELDLAFDPANAVNAKDVCEIQVPSISEIWDQVKTAPNEIWRNMRNLDIVLPDMPFDGWLTASIDWFGSLDDWITAK